MAIVSETFGISDEYAAQPAMPKKHSLSQALSRKQREGICLQTLALTDCHFEVPDDFAHFLLQDRGKEKQRILLIGDAIGENVLKFSNTWLVDGTFKLSPEIFYQSYTIKLQSFAPPCVYVLLLNKTEKN